MMSHTSAVNGNVNSYRNAPDNLNCMWLTYLNYLCQLCDMLYYCYKWESRQMVGCTRQFGLCYSTVLIFNPSMIFLFLDVGMLQ